MQPGNWLHKMFVDRKRYDDKRAVLVQGLRDRIGFGEEGVDILQQVESYLDGRRWPAQRRYAA